MKTSASHIAKWKIKEIKCIIFTTSIYLLTLIGKWGYCVCMHIFMDVKK